jgi:hypothetical protein
MENKDLLNRRRQLIALICLIIAAVVSRLLPHPPNVAPVAGLALFAGASISGPKKFLLPLIIMILSDIFLGFHRVMPYVYGSFILITLLGTVLKIKNSFSLLVTMSLISSALFYLITNFGVWLHSGMYAKTVGGLLQSYIMALPFFQNTLVGDMIYTITIFYGYRIIEHFTVSRASAKH